jgi:hypothetical protein
MRLFKTTESSHRRAQWCSLLQMIVMAAVTVCNLFYLQHYFKSKKLV